MFNVYPVQLCYTFTPSSGILAGLPLACRAGMASRAACREMIADLQKRDNGIYSNFEIQSK